MANHGRHLALPPALGFLLALALAGSLGSAGPADSSRSSADAPAAAATAPGTDAFLDASDRAHEALPEGRRSATRLTLRHVPPPAGHPLAEAPRTSVPSGALEPLAPPAYRPAGGLPAGFLPDHALSPPSRA